MNDNSTSLLSCLLAKLEVAKRHTKEHIDRIKEEIEDYEAETPRALSLEDLLQRQNAMRYEYTAKVIFDSVEKYRSSVFEKPPEVLYIERGADDTEKAKKIAGAWEYLKDKTNFKQFMDDSFTYFAANGFVTGHVGYKKEPVTAEGEDGVNYSQYKVNDPFIEVYEYDCEWFMPDSKFSPDARDVSYFRKKKMKKGEVLTVFDIEDIETDEAIMTDNIDDESEALKSEMSRVGVYYHYGSAPKRALASYLADNGTEGFEGLGEDDVDDGEYETPLYFAFTKNKILAVAKSPINEPLCAIGRWYASPKKFFGYGLAKLLKEQQRQESIRIGQKIRYADLYAFPKLAINLKDKTSDPKQLMQRDNPILLFSDQPPQWLTPPASNGVTQMMLEQNQSDIQTNSGLTDLSRSQNSRTLQTATGQTQVSETNEKRVKIAREKYFDFLKQVIIKMFKYVQLEWDEAKLATVTGEDGDTEEIEISSEDLAGIDFDTDVIVDFENVSVNKDVLRQQSIVMYDKIKDDPLVDRAKLLKNKLFRDGFGEKNPDQYIKESQITPGMKFFAEDGSEYVADESGTVVPSQDEADTRPSGGDEMEPAADAMGVQTNPAMQAGLEG